MTRASQLDREIDAALGWTKIWRLETSALDPSHAKWHHVKDVLAANAEQWVAVLRRDDPRGTYQISATRPRGKKGVKAMRGPGSEY